MSVVTKAALKAKFETGDFPPEQDFIDFIDTVYPYESYVATLNQTGTNAPVATVLENTLGGTLVWSYAGVGVYYATLSGAFPTQSKVALFISTFPGVTDDRYGSDFYWRSANELELHTYVSTTPTNGIMTPMSVEVRVYS